AVEAMIAERSRVHRGERHHLLEVALGDRLEGHIGLSRLPWRRRRRGRRCCHASGKTCGTRHGKRRDDRTAFYFVIHPIPPCRAGPCKSRIMTKTVMHGKHRRIRPLVEPLLSSPPYMSSPLAVLR